MHRTLALFVAAIAALAALAPPGGASPRQGTFPGSDWETATPEEMGMDSGLLAQALAATSGNVAVVRSGYLVGTKGDVARRYPLYSVSKSITALAFGVLLERGQASLDDAVPGSDLPYAPLATYRQFLSMTSDYGLDPHAPGQYFAYNNKAVDACGESLRPHFGGLPPLDVVNGVLFTVTGRQDSCWFGGLWGGWGGGFEFSARDVARLGLLVLRDGNWAGQRVVPDWFVQAFYDNQIPPGATASYSIGSGATQGPPGNNWWNQFHVTELLPGNYSFGWWTNAGGLYPGLPQRTIWADGLNGHKILVVPEQDLVVTVTYGGNGVTPEAVLQPILSAIVGPPGGGGGDGAARGDGMNPPPGGVVSGELRQWHRVALTFAGPVLQESSPESPFRDYRLDVEFRQGSRAYVVPGHFAADGDAAASSATGGGVWRAYFTPDAAGRWSYRARFRQGFAVAVSNDPDAGWPAAFDGAKGTFDVMPSDKQGADLRRRGQLVYTGERYLRFAGTGEPFLKGGADSPENFLAYAGFDGTTPSHDYQPHGQDWRQGDQDFGNGRGRNIVGALNYLASRGMNSIYFLTMNVQGDGNDVWPWPSPTARFAFDVSKLDQWEVVFQQADRLGIHLHVVTQETENDQLLDGGALGAERKIYYRELVSRFAHHPALTWNLGEENTNSTAERMAFADWIRELDPYDHPIVVHTYPGWYDQVYTPLLGHPTLEGPSLQMGDMQATHAETAKWIARSRAAGRPWVVTLDEIGPANSGVLPDIIDPAHDAVRHHALWGNLMAGGAGVEWYFGYSYAHDDLDCEDWRSRERMWDLTRHALQFFAKYLPFDRMESADLLASAPGARVLAAAGECYAVYLPEGGTTSLDLEPGDYMVHWYNPRFGGALQQGSVAEVQGGGWRSLGLPPGQTSSDWVARVALRNPYVEHYGQGVAGFLGLTPLIDGEDPRLGSERFEVRLERARPFTSAVLQLGREAAAIPLGAGHLLTDASGGVFHFITTGAGQATLALPLPPRYPLDGVPLYWQFLVLDEDAPASIAMTGGLMTVLHR